MHYPWRHAFIRGGEPFPRQQLGVGGCAPRVPTARDLLRRRWPRLGWGAVDAHVWGYVNVLCDLLLRTVSRWDICFQAQQLFEPVAAFVEAQVGRLMFFRSMHRNKKCAPHAYDLHSALSSGRAVR